MKIAIDARMYGLENGGIGRYVVNLINELSSQDRENTYYILLRQKYFQSLTINNPNFKKILSNYSHYSFAEQLRLPYQLWKIRPDLTHFPHFNVPLLWFGPYVVTIHDLIKHFYKGINSTTRQPLFYWAKYFIYRLVSDLAIKRAAIIITPSLFWKNYLAKNYHILPYKIKAIYEGVDHRDPNLDYLATQIKQTLTKYKITKPYIIYVGNLYPHKNVDILFRAAKEMKIGVVVVCARNFFRSRAEEIVSKIGGQDYVNFVGFVPDDELRILYRESLCLVFPSLMEGFGLPGLEAMEAGTAVIAADSSCLPEVYGRAALYFNPNDLNQLIEKIHIIESSQTRRKFITEGKKQIKKYSWDRMGKQTISTYQQVL